jgi:hypothetical protein
VGGGAKDKIYIYIVNMSIATPIKTYSKKRPCIRGAWRYLTNKNLVVKKLVTGSLSEEFQGPRRKLVMTSTVQKKVH